MTLLVLFIFQTNFFLVNLANDACKSKDLKNIPVVFSTDNGFFPPTLIAMVSLFENANASTFYDVSLLISDSFGLENKLRMASLKEKYENCKIDFINMTGRFQAVSKNYFRFPAPAYYRLCLPSILQNVKKCILLDGDVIVRHDLLELFDTDVDAYYVAGVRHLIIHKDYEKILNIPDKNQYINSGVMVMNLEKMREDNLENTMLERVTKDAEKFGKSLWFPDQDIINAVCYGKILFLPLRFNFFLICLDFDKPFEESLYARQFSTPIDWKEAIDDPTIVHFAAKPKPWMRGRRLPSVFYKEFWDYEKKVNVFGKRLMVRKRRKKTIIRRRFRKSRRSKVAAFRNPDESDESDDSDEDNVTDLIPE